MVLLALAVAAVVTMCVTGGGRRWRARRGRPEPAAPPTVEAPMAESLEGLLALKLAAGDLNREQYRRAMEMIAAARDGRWRTGPSRR